MSASLLNMTSRWRIDAHHSSNPSKAKNVSNWQLGLEGGRHVHAQAACSPQRSIGLEVHQDVVVLCVSDDTGQVLERQRCACTRDA